MVNVIVASHGMFAQAAVELVGMLSGPPQNVHTISFDMGESLDTLLARFTQTVDSFEEGGDVVILADIKGGSPGNVGMLMQKTRPNARVLFGLNIAMLLQVLEDRDAGAGMDELVQNALAVGRMAVCDMPDA